MGPFHVHISLCAWSEIPRDLICLQRPHTKQQSHCQLVSVRQPASPLLSLLQGTSSVQWSESAIHGQEGRWVETARLFTDCQPKPSCTPRA